jgi:hypothetical protein
MGTLSIFLLSPMYTNGQVSGPKPPVAGPKPQVVAGPPDLAVTVTSNTQSLVGSSRTTVNQLAEFSIAVKNLLTTTQAMPLILSGSDARLVTLRVTLPADGTLWQVGNIGADSGFTCKAINNTVVCTGGTIAAGQQAHIAVDVAAIQGPCSKVAQVTAAVDPAQNEVNLTNNNAATSVTVVNIC